MGRGFFTNRCVNTISYHLHIQWQHKRGKFLKKAIVVQSFYFLSILPKLHDLLILPCSFKLFLCLSHIFVSNVSKNKQLQMNYFYNKLVLMHVRTQTENQTPMASLIFNNGLICRRAKMCISLSVKNNLLRIRIYFLHKLRTDIGQLVKIVNTCT